MRHVINDQPFLVFGDLHRYTYSILWGTVADPFERRHVWELGRKRKLNVEAMRAAARCLIGRHDFSALSIINEGDDRNPVKVRGMSIAHAPHEWSVYWTTSACCSLTASSRPSLLVICRRWNVSISVRALRGLDWSLSRLCVTATCTR